MKEKKGCHWWGTLLPLARARHGCGNYVCTMFPDDEEDKMKKEDMAINFFLKKREKKRQVFFVNGIWESELSWLEEIQGYWVGKYG